MFGNKLKNFFNTLNGKKQVQVSVQENQESVVPKSEEQ